MMIEFTVQDIPPKKDGANSMWKKPAEALRIVSLRKEALRAMREANISDCFRSFVRLEITLFAPKSKMESIGDLDNFITGVCDGVQLH